ncbi:MAG: ribosome silencing factor [Gammaproteobacteria bacterium]|nr:ribosome silencing factor [Gammaproteobacteria bacterium]HBX00516.1 ribosome silencing factor [Gammaproteobacteria bacterium]
MKASELRDHVVAALEDLKGVNIVTLDVAALTPMTDHMVLVTGTSNRHVKALVDTANESSKALGIQPLGIEGRESYDWVLVDLADVIVHVMNEEARNFYELERLWSDLDELADTEQAADSLSNQEAEG